MLNVPIKLLWDWQLYKKYKTDLSIHFRDDMTTDNAVREFSNSTYTEKAC